MREGCGFLSWLVHDRCHFGGCSPGDFSQLLTCEAVSACLARFNKSSRSIPGLARSAAFRKRSASSANRSSNVAVCLTRRRFGIAPYQRVCLVSAFARQRTSQGGSFIPLRGCNNHSNAERRQAQNACLAASAELDIAIPQVLIGRAKGQKVQGKFGK
jgi:hypothetical protein